MTTTGADRGIGSEVQGQGQAQVYSSARVEYVDGGAIAEVVLIGPGKGNSMGPDFWREMPALFAGLDRDETVRAVIVRGQGAHFSYGLDLPAMMNEPGMHFTGDNLAAQRTHLYDNILRMQEAINAAERCRKPVIAAVSGWCIGAGVDLISACDLRVCSSDARFSVREVKVAIVADMGSLQRLPYIIGDGYTRELALTGKDIDAARAMHIGLVSEVAEGGAEAAIEAARAVARGIAANPPVVTQGVKRVLNECRDRSVEEGLRHVAVWNAAFMQSNDLGEAMTAFMERRAPQFRGQ